MYIHTCIYIYIYIYIQVTWETLSDQLDSLCQDNFKCLTKLLTGTDGATYKPGTRWLRLVCSLKLQVFFAKEPYKRDYILQNSPILLRSLLSVATPYGKRVRSAAYIYDTKSAFIYEFMYVKTPIKETCLICVVMKTPVCTKRPVYTKRDLYKRPI